MRGGFFALLSLSFAAAVFALYSGGAAKEVRTDTVEVLQDGEVIYRFTAQELEEERYIRVPCGEHENIIVTGGGKIRVASADCPDQICVQMGELRRADRPILCLPHRLEIRYAQEAPDAAGIPDAVAK